MPGISATLICQLKPIGASTGSIQRPIMAARLKSIAFVRPPATRKRRQEPDQNHHGKDRGAGALQKRHRALIKIHQHAAQLRQLVIWQFQHEGRRRAFTPEKVVGDEDTASALNDSHRIEPEHHEPLQSKNAKHWPVWYERRDNQRINRDRAEQVINGATMIVVSLSRLLSITRVAMIPGIAQAKLDSSGIKARPCSPAPPMIRSIRNAARAI